MNIPAPKNNAFAEMLTYRTEDGERTHEKNIYEGVLHESESGFTFTYQDIPEPAAPSNIRLSTLTVKNGSDISLRHRGACRAEFVFSTETPRSVDYETPYGTVVMTLHTMKAIYSQEADRHILQLHYHLFSDRQQVSETHMKIVIKKREEPHEKPCRISKITNQ